MRADAVRSLPRPHGVLVADDDAEIRDAMHSGLLREGFAVWSAANGREALDIYRFQHGAIDVVLLDVCMPELDGPRTLMALQELVPDIRCCFITGYLDNYTSRGLRRLGAATVVRKPFHLSELADVLRRIVGGANANRAPCADARPRDAPKP